MDMTTLPRLPTVLQDVAEERFRQAAKWGPEDDYPSFSARDLTDSARRDALLLRDVSQQCCEDAAKAGTCSFADILKEEAFEALAERDDPAALRKELVQVAAVAIKWIESLDKAADAPLKVPSANPGEFDGWRLEARGQELWAVSPNGMTSIHITGEN